MPIDKSRYPPDWDDRSARIQERDQYRCRHCGAKSGEVGQHDDYSHLWYSEEELKLLKEQGEVNSYTLKTTVLTVAHLDHDETNWHVKDDRLITLCATCHLRYDRNDNQLRKQYGKNYRDNQLTLFNPRQYGA